MNDFSNAFRNLVLATLLGLFLFILSLYFSSLIVTYAVYKQLSLDFALSTQPFNALYGLIIFWRFKQKESMKKSLADNSEKGNRFIRPKVNVNV